MSEQDQVNNVVFHLPYTQLYGKGLLRVEG